MSEFNFDTNIIVNIVSNIDFSSSPSKLCVKLTNKKFYLKYTNNKNIFLNKKQIN
jgi:hypothetical protein